MTEQLRAPLSVPDFYSESKLEGFCCDFARLWGVPSYKLSAKGKVGFPDRTYYFPEDVYVEFKHPNGKGVVDENQGRRHAELRALGKAVYVCDNFAYFYGIMCIHWEPNK